MPDNKIRITSLIILIFTILYIVFEVISIYFLLQEDKTKLLFVDSSFHMAINAIFITDFFIQVTLASYIALIFNSYRQGIIFTESVIKKYMVIGILFIIKAGHIILSESVIATAQAVNDPTPNTFVISTEIFEPIITGIIIFAIAWIMKRALLLQQENEYTV